MNRDIFSLEWYWNIKLLCSEQPFEPLLNTNKSKNNLFYEPRCQSFNGNRLNRRKKVQAIRIRWKTQPYFKLGKINFSLSNLLDKNFDSFSRKAPFLSETSKVFPLPLPTRQTRSIHLDQLSFRCYWGKFFHFSILLQTKDNDVKIFLPSQRNNWHKLFSQNTFFHEGFFMSYYRSWTPHPPSSYFSP